MTDTLTTTQIIEHLFESNVTRAEVESTSYPLGIHFMISFDNGRGASIIKNDSTYGDWEVLPTNAAHTDFRGYAQRHADADSVMSSLESIAAL